MTIDANIFVDGLCKQIFMYPAKILHMEQGCLKLLDRIPHWNMGPPYAYAYAQTFAASWLYLSTARD